MKLGNAYLLYDPDAFAPGTGRDLNIIRGNPGVHPGSGTPLEALTTTYEREATPDELRAAHDSVGGGDAGTAAAQALLDEGKQLREATVIFTGQASPGQKLHELGHVEQSLKDPEGAARDAAVAQTARAEAQYKAAKSEIYAEDFAKDAQKTKPNPL